jgi:hypothetical protein
MREWNLRTAASAIIIAFISVASPLATPAAARERPGPSAEFAAGALLFADDGVVREGFVGGAVRFYLLPRVSIGPELASIEGTNHSHLMLTGNVTFDSLGPVGGRPRMITPFAVVGAGLFRTRESFPGNEDFASSEGAFTAGGGVRFLVGERVMLGAEARIGWELHIRLNAMVGVRLGE